MLRTLPSIVGKALREIFRDLGKRNIWRPEQDFVGDRDTCSLKPTKSKVSRENPGRIESLL